MKKIIPALLLTIALASCNGWVIQPLPNPTPIVFTTPTPSVFTATPVVIGVATSTATPSVATPTDVSFITATTAPTLVLPSDTPTSTETSIPGGPSVSVEILGCNTSIDIAHGMGEVTNAFVILRNTGGVDLTNLITTLKALDEGRVHPDKTIEVASLPIGYQVTLKLTVDSTYKEDTPIQIEVVGDGGLFQRVGTQSCRDIGVLAPNPDGLYTPVPLGISQ